MQGKNPQKLKDFCGFFLAATHSAFAAERR
jgi:hypothetical protein